MDSDVSSLFLIVNTSGIFPLEIQGTEIMTHNESVIGRDFVDVELPYCVIGFVKTSTKFMAEGFTTTVEHETEVDNLRVMTIVDNLCFPEGISFKKNITLGENPAFKMILRNNGNEVVGVFDMRCMFGGDIYSERYVVDDGKFEGRNLFVDRRKNLREIKDLALDFVNKSVSLSEFRIRNIRTSRWVEPSVDLKSFHLPPH